jgi:hypothetical protein
MDFPARLYGYARCIVLYVVGFFRVGIVRGLWKGRLAASKQENTEQGEGKATWYNADASSLAFHGSPVSRRAGLPRGLGLMRDSITGAWQNK